MKNPIQAMFEAGIVESTDFPPESRYHGIPTATFTTPDGEEQALDDKLTDDATSSSADREAHRHLPRARRRAAAQKTGKIGARDDQDGE